MMALDKKKNQGITKLISYYGPTFTQSKIS